MIQTLLEAALVLHAAFGLLESLVGGLLGSTSFIGGAEGLVEASFELRPEGVQSLQADLAQLIGFIPA